MSVLSHPVLIPAKPCSQAPGRGTDLQDNDYLAGDLSILDASVLDIRGNGGGHEKLDHRYHMRSGAEQFFAVGRIFASLWHEDASDKKGGHLSQTEPFNGQSDGKRKGKHKKEVLSHSRRKIVIKARNGYCRCLSINTYNSRGVAKKGLSPEHRRAHSIIYMDDTNRAG